MTIVLSVIGASQAIANIDGVADDDSITLTGREAAQAEFLHRHVPNPDIEYLRAPACGGDPDRLVTADTEPCPDLDLAPPVLDACPEAAAVPPLWRRERVAGTWSRWQMVDPTWSCPADATALVPFTAADFRRLPLAPGPVHLQPDRDWWLVNMPTVVHSSPNPQTLTTTLLGVPVTVEATPVAWLWDFGDGTTIASDAPGRPWPTADIAHRYATTGRYAVTLTTTWAGRYRAAGGGWADVAGTATTTTVAPARDVVESRVRLVSGTCLDDPRGPGC